MLLDTGETKGIWMPEKVDLLIKRFKYVGVIGTWYTTKVSFCIVPHSNNKRSFSESTKNKEDIVSSIPS